MRPRSPHEGGRKSEQTIQPSVSGLINPADARQILSGQGPFFFKATAYTEIGWVTGFFCLSPFPPQRLIKVRHTHTSILPRTQMMKFRWRRCEGGRGGKSLDCRFRSTPSRVLFAREEQNCRVPEVREVQGVPTLPCPAFSPCGACYANGR